MSGKRGTPAVLVADGPPSGDADRDGQVGALPPGMPLSMSRGAWLAEVIKDRILNGRYAPGERLREAELQREFNFSNGPVREALQTVVAATLAESAPWQGVRVVSLSRREIGDLFQLRTALLEYIAERAARHAPPAVRERGAVLQASLRRAFADAENAGGQPTFGGELSAWLLEGAGNAMLTQTWDNITLRSRIYVNDALRRGDRTVSMRLLSALIDAVATRNPDAAREAARGLTQHLLTRLEIDVVL